MFRSFLLTTTALALTPLLGVGCTSSGRGTTSAPTTTQREYDTARGVPTTARETGALQGQTTRAATGNVD